MTGGYFRCPTSLWQKVLCGLSDMTFRITMILQKNNQSFCGRFFVSSPENLENSILIDLVKIYILWFVLSDACHTGDLSLEILCH